MVVSARVDISLAKATNYLPMGVWQDMSRYHLSDAGIPVVKYFDGTSAGFSVYALNVEHSTKGLAPSGNNSEWKLMESAEFIYMLEAYIERLQATLITAKHIESLTIRTKNIEILEGAKVGGALNGVTGTFKALQAVDGNGKVVGGIRFSADGRMWFEGDMQHQGYNSAKNRSYRFLTSDLWCRGVLGARERTVLIVEKGGYWAYPNGLAESGSALITLTASSISGGGTYYTIPLYLGEGDMSGCPIDVVLVRNSTNYNYVMDGAQGKTVKVVNIDNSDGTGFNIYCGGRENRLAGGCSSEFIYVGDKLSPYDSTNIGAGWIKMSFFDFNWG